VGVFVRRTLVQVPTITQVLLLHYLLVFFHLRTGSAAGASVLNNELFQKLQLQERCNYTAERYSYDYVTPVLNCRCHENNRMRAAWYA